MLWRSRSRRSLRMKRVLFLLVIAATALSANSQNTLKGKVFTPDSELGHNGEVQYIPLPGATVIWKGTRLGAMTDAHGYFKLPAMNIGDTLQVSMVGYNTAGLVYSGQKYVEIPLEQGVALEAAEVETRGSSTMISLLDPLNVQQLNRKELEKAACCNLSEAFETNASVDASFTDAVTGTRQIRMLGLDGKYTQILQDNLPGPRGLNVVQGLSFIPGPWINTIAISKGTGSVTNGYESITGEINVAMLNPENADTLHVNIYGSGDGRVEWNHVSRHTLGRRWSTSILTHAEYADRVNDRNGDYFLDTPLKNDIVLRNEWKYRGDRGVRGEYCINAVDMNRQAGQMESVLNPWIATTDIQRVEVSAKTGYVFPNKPGTSLGSQFIGSYHHHEHVYGEKTYSGTEKYFRGNILFSSILGTTDHKYTTGISFLYDDFYEGGDWNGDNYFNAQARTEVVPGAYFEYTWTPSERLTVVSGLRGDLHNMYGAFVTPRLHARYSIAEETSIKLVAGSGFRTANVLMEHLGVWASSRNWQFLGDLQPEEATNVGLNLVSKFRLNSRDASLSIDGYWTEFQNRVVADLYTSADYIYVYNAGNSSSKTLQAEFDWAFHRRFDLRMAYRWVDAKTLYQIDSAPTRDPFISEHRAFAQLSYASKKKKDGRQVRVDGTLHWVGEQRLPTADPDASDFEYFLPISPDFYQVNLQVSRMFANDFELYAGVENLLNVKQENPIVGSMYPDEFNDTFDASLVYGPIFGRMTYAGLRWTVGRLNP